MWNPNTPLSEVNLRIEALLTKKGDFSSKMANIDSNYDSIIHFMIKFNSKDNSISIFQEYSIQKIIQ